MTEFELIASLTKDAPREALDLVHGIGDDCAVFSGGSERDWLVTTDALIEGVHFKNEWTGAKTLGRKALAVNLSDIAAMGGTPRFYLVSLGLPKTPGKEDAFTTAKELYAGMGSMAAEHDVILIGGDTVASPSGLMLSITVIGECARGKSLLRSGARKDDAIFVTGTPGLSGLGLEFLKTGRSNTKAASCIARHNDPTPRINEGKWLASTGMATAMIDTSDGLLVDLGHIADESGVGFEVNAAKVPRAKDLDDLSRSIGSHPDTLVLTGGEDYELLFTIAAERIGEFEGVLDKMPGNCKAARIGTMLGKKEGRRVLDGSGKMLRFESSGFDHFGGCHSERSEESR